MSASQVVQWKRICLPMQETQVPSLGWKDPLEEEMATHSSILAWIILWTEEPGGIQSTGSQRVRHDLTTKHNNKETLQVANCTSLDSVTWFKSFCLWVEGQKHLTANSGPWSLYSSQQFVESFYRDITLKNGEGNGNPLQYSCLEYPMEGGAWWAAVHGVEKSRTRLSDFTFTFHFPALEKDMATRSSVLAWRIPGTVEADRLPSMG